MVTKSGTRMIGINALSIFFAFGACASFLSFVSLLFPGSFLEPMWRLNPRARIAFFGMGNWALILLCVVCIACAMAAVGLWRRQRWAYWLAVGLLLVNLFGDLANVALGNEPRAAIGIPIVIAVLLDLTRPGIRTAFGINLIKPHG